MKVHFKITASLAAAVRQDLKRRHPFAHERVGFVSAGLSPAGDELLVLARGYRPVADHDYLRDPSVGAMMGPNAIRSAMQWAMQAGTALFHVHSHGGRGLPRFSGIDIRENAKFVPDFFKVAPQMPHGAIVLSGDSARGQIWVDRGRVPLSIAEFTEVGMPTRCWKTA